MYRNLQSLRNDFAEERENFSYGTSNLEKLAFKYNQDLIGALGGGLLGGGLGYASGTDGKNNTPNNRMKRALIGAGIGGGVGLGFGRMGRKLTGVQGELNEAKALNDERLRQMRGLHDRYGQEMSALRNQHVEESKRRVIENNARFADQGQRYADELEAMRGQRDEFRTKFEDLNRQMARQKRETPEVSPVPDVQQAAPSAARQRTNAIMESWEEENRQREVKRLRKKLRKFDSTRGAIPDSVLESMSAEDLTKAIKKRETRSADQSAFQETLKKRKDRRKKVVEDLQLIGASRRSLEDLADKTERMTPEQISAFAKKHQLEGVDLRDRSNQRVQDILDTDEGTRYFDNLRLQNMDRVDNTANERRKRALNRYRQQMKTSSFKYTRDVGGALGGGLLGGGLGYGSGSTDQEGKSNRFKRSLIGATAGGLTGLGLGRMSRQLGEARNLSDSFKSQLDDVQNLRTQDLDAFAEDKAKMLAANEGLERNLEFALDAEKILTREKRDLELRNMSLLERLDTAEKEVRRRRDEMEELDSFFPPGPSVSDPFDRERLEETAKRFNIDSTGMSNAELDTAIKEARQDQLPFGNLRLRDMVSTSPGQEKKSAFHNHLQYKRGGATLLQ